MRYRAFPVRGPGFYWDAAELEARVAAAASALAASLAPGGAHVAVARQDADWVVEALAVWRLGGVLVPLHPDLPERERALVEEDLHGARELPDGAAAVVWTSGTAGRPRGVILGHDGLAYVGVASAQRLGLTARDVWALTLSTAHVGGLATLVRAAVVGHGLWVAGPFDAEGLDGAIEAGHATFASLVPIMLERLLAARAGRPVASTLRGILLGGAAAPRPLVERARAAGVPVFLTYGMTEASSQVATAPPTLVEAKPGTVGTPLEGTEVRISDEGEIEVRGPGLALGRLGGNARLPDEGGWFRTGDLGRIDHEGHLFVTGRASDRVISGGVNVDPLEVEGVLRRSASVQDVCVVGMPDPEWGERVVAVVQWNAGREDREGLEAWARAQLRAAQRPRAWVTCTELPRNRSGKVDRAAARELAGRALHP
ncbi:MAG: AMP-binding protein [Gemmatimonadota bacterium]